MNGPPCIYLNETGVRIPAGARLNGIPRGYGCISREFSLYSDYISWLFNLGGLTRARARRRWDDQTFYSFLEKDSFPQGWKLVVLYGYTSSALVFSSFYLCEYAPALWKNQGPYVVDTRFDLGVGNSIPILYHHEPYANIIS